MTGAVGDEATMRRVAEAMKERDLCKAELAKTPTTGERFFGKAGWFIVGLAVGVLAGAATK